MAEVKIKLEPVDTGYKEASSYNPDEPVEGKRIKSLMKGTLGKSNQGESIKNVIEELLQKNEALMAQSDPIPFKPNPRTVYQKDNFRPNRNTRPSNKKDDINPIKPNTNINIVRPKSPTRTCEIPQKDISHIGQTLMEMGVFDKATETFFDSMTHEMVCGVASNAFLMTTEGVNLNIQTDLQFYWCNFCPFKTEQKQTLLQHVMEHRFQCKFCTYQSFSRSDVIRHAAKEHADFRSTAESLKYCTFLPDFLKLQGTTAKRKHEEGGSEPATKKPKPEIGPKPKIAVAETMFEMEVDEVDEDENESSEEENETEKVIVPRKTESSNEPKNMAAPKPHVVTPVVTPSQTTIPKTVIKKPQKAKPVNTTTVSSGLSLNCGYCEFVTLNQTFLKMHLNTEHRRQAHKYVVMMVSSQDEMNKIKENDNQIYSSRNPSLLSIIVVSSSSSASKLQKTVTQNSKIQDNSEEVTEYISAEKKSKYPLTFKCPHCNFNALICFKIKEHLLFKHPGCLLYALDIRAVKLKQKRFVFFCHRQNCSFKTNKTEEYINHSENCTPWLEPGCLEKIDISTKKCLALTRGFSKSSKCAEYSCVHCPYTSNNITRVKKHVIADHEDSETVMRDLQAPKMVKNTNVYFCKVCLWETRINGELGDHLKEKHNEQLEAASKSPPSPKITLMPKIVSVTSIKEDSTPSPSVTGSDAANMADYNDTDPEHQEPDDGYEGLEIPEEDIQRMMDDYITDEASRNKTSERPNRAAATKASAHVQAQEHSPTLFKCLHCHHMNFGETLMKSHLTTIHPGTALRAIDVKKKSQKSNPYICFCPKELCKYVHSNEENVANHAEQNHTISCDSAEIKAILQPYVPSSSPEKHVFSGAKTSDHYECVYCKTPVQRNTTLKMRQHLLAEHPDKDLIFKRLCGTQS